MRRGRLGVAVLALAVGLAGAVGCASSSGGARPRPFPSAGRPEAPLPPGSPSPPATGHTPQRPGARETAPAPDAALARSVVDRATLLLGTPYRNGGADPRGFDCSGFIEWVFAADGIRVPRTVVQLFDTGYPVARGGVAPGDLVFFSTTSSGPTHVGLALGSGDFVHAPSSRGRVRLDRLESAYWSARYLGARRLTAAAGTNGRPDAR